MGGGNAQKSATARERNAEKAKKAKGGESQAKKNAAALSIICGICRSTFVCTSSRAKLQEHVDGKHPKSKFEDCFKDVAAA